MSFTLRLFGGATLAGEQGPLSGPAVQRHRLALLALLAGAWPRPVSREKLMAWLWPERDTEPARRLLNQAVHALRQALGAEAIVSSGDDLQLDTRSVHCDLTAFEEAFAAGAPERAVALYAGPFLDGFFLDDAPEFERWVDGERDRLSTACARALEELAEAAERAGDLAGAVERWKARAALDRLDSRVALRLMQALERAGNRAGALQHAVQHRQLLRDELEIEPDREVLALMEELRRSPAPPSAPSKSALPRTDRPSPVEPAGPSAPVAAAARRPGGFFLYATVAVLAAVAIGGAIRLASGSGGRERAGGGTASAPAADEIARAVARELDRRERGDTGRRSPETRTRSLAAYELVLRGQDPVLIRSDSGARKGLEYFRRAVALDSSYAAAWVGLARLTVRSAAPADRKRAVVEGERAARRALALDDSLAEAHALLGVYRAMSQDYAESEDHFRRALTVEPRRARIREWYVAFLLMMGRREEALVEARRAVQVDPLSPTANAELARALAANGHCDEALTALERLETVEPPPLRVAGIAARCYGQLGRWTEAVAVLRPQAADSGGTLALLGYMTARGGNRDEARAIQARLTDRWGRGAVDAMTMVFVPAALGDRDEAFAWLERARQDGSLAFSPGLRVDWSEPPFDALQGDRRLDQLRARLGLQNR